ncbi:MAG: HD-GYP domain-containing protein [Bacillota bacterium]
MFVPVSVRNLVIGGVKAISAGNIPVEQIKRFLEHNRAAVIAIIEEDIRWRKAVESLLWLHELSKIRLEDMAFHAQNVGFWAVEIARRTAYPAERLERLYLAAMFHDIGNVWLPREMLASPRPLTPAERSMVQKHPDYGFEITGNLLGDFDDLRDIPEWIRFHHEKYDGTGYPLGLARDRIPLESRIIKVADAIDAMVSKRPYRESFKPEEVVDELEACKGKDFDPEIADVAKVVFLERLRSVSDTIEEPMVPAFLLIDRGETRKLYEGTIMKVKDERVFRADGVVYEFEKEQGSMSALILVERAYTLYEYDAELLPVGGIAASITRLRLREDNRYFSVFWNFPGKLMAGNSVFDVVITRLSASAAEFSAKDSKSVHVLGHAVGKMKLVFPNGASVDVPGFILRRISGSERFIFAFTNIAEKTRSFLLQQMLSYQIRSRQLFRK